MRTRFDVLGLGCTAVDDLLYVTAYPPPDAKARVIRRDRRCGGLTATALIAAARLGQRCAYAGVLGDDEASIVVRQSFREAGVEVRHAARRPRARPVRSVIIVDEGRHTRNIFYDASGVCGADPTWPTRTLIAASKVLLVDRFGAPGMIRAARFARADGVGVVGDFENQDWAGFAELFALPDHLILSEDFATRFTGTSRPGDAVERLWNEDRKLVAVTCGARGCWFKAAVGAAPEHVPAFRVEVRDTTGCGDVFHGAYAAALARGLPVRERIRVAAAAAALKAAARGGQAGIPTWPVVQRLLRGQSRS